MAMYLYYPGCMSDTSEDEYGRSLRATGALLNIEFEELDDWNCCGSIAAADFGRELAGALCARVVKLAQVKKQDIVAACPECVKNLRAAFGLVTNDGKFRARVSRVLDHSFRPDFHVRHVSEIFAHSETLDLIGKNRRRDIGRLRVVHFPGALANCILSSASEADPVEKVLRAAGATVLPWSYKHENVGANLWIGAPDVVRGLVARLITAARDAGAQAIATACPHSMAVIDGNQRRAGLTGGKKPVPVFYFSELAGFALGADGAEDWFLKHCCEPFEAFT